MDSVHELVRLVVRAFYPEEYAVIIDALIRERYIKDDELAEKLKLQQKNVRKVLAHLKEDQLVACATKSESAKKAAAAAAGTDAPPKQPATHTHSYWYLSYRDTVHAIRYRLHQMQKLLLKQVDQELETHYFCPLEGCGRRYTALEAQRLADPRRGYLFICEQCGNELDEDDTGRGLSNKAQVMYDTMKVQLHRINSALQQTEKFILPAVTIPSRRALKDGLKHADGSSAHGDASSSKAGGGGSSVFDSVKIKVDFDDMDGSFLSSAPSSSAATTTKMKFEKTSKKELPPWMQSSSVPQTQASTSAAPASASAPQSTTQTTAASAAAASLDPAVYKAYMEQYSKMLQAQKASTADQIPTMEDEGPSYSYSQTEVDYEPPRSRSVSSAADELGFEDAHNNAEPPQALEENENGWADAGEAVQDEEVEETEEADMDVIVYVAGEAKLLSEVTQEDKDLMSLDEYKVYYEAHQAQNGIFGE